MGKEVTVPLITEEAEYPIALTDRWGTFLFNKDTPADLQMASKRLLAKYDNAEFKGWTEGDPRQYLGAQELSFIACRGKHLGILVEVETGIRNVDGKWQYEGDGGYLSAGDMSTIVESLRSELQDVQNAFPYGESFVTYGDHIFNNRLAIGMFVPLGDLSGDYFVWPERETDGSKEVDVVTEAILATLERVQLEEAVPEIETYISAAQKHGEDSEPDHEVGDLQDFLRILWGLTTPELKKAFAKRKEVLAVLDACQ